MSRLAFFQRIGNAAAVLSKRWGGVTKRVSEAGCSRQAAYKNAARWGRSLELLETHPDLEAILQENRRLANENATLRKEAVRVSEDCQQEFAVTASAMGVSITQITTLLGIVLPESKCPGRTKIGDWVKKWAIKAGEILRVVDPVCRQHVEEACLDEIFLDANRSLSVSNRIAWRGSLGRSRTDATARPGKKQSSRGIDCSMPTPTPAAGSAKDSR
jgi:hypothetical protein